MIDCDIAVIGGGPGGYVAAIRAAQIGKKTVLIEERELGGTCLNRGCIPTKALLHSAEVYCQVKNSRELGVETSGCQFNLAHAQNYKNKVVQKLRQGVEYLLRANGVKIINGTGRITDPQHIIVRSAYGEENISAKKIVIATGSKAVKLPIPGFDDTRVITSDDALNLIKIPNRLLVVGGGAVGLEFATLFNKLGSNVTIAEMLPRIIPNDDEEISRELQKHLEANGISVWTNTSIHKAAASQNALIVTGKNKNGEFEIEVDLVLCAAGRSANTENLGLEQFDIVDKRGFVNINDNYVTSIPSIYAIGDVNGRLMLAHAASAQGIQAVEHAFGIKGSKGNPRLIPSCVYTDPEVAAVGENEEQLKAKGIKYRAGKFSFNSNGRAMTLKKAYGFVKVLSDEKTGEIYGVHAIGPDVSNLIMEAAIAMSLEATATELGEAVHPHPSLSEVFQEAFLAVNQKAIHAVNSKRK